MSDIDKPVAIWPPRDSASSYSEGHQKRGSTGQLWQVHQGKWVRVPEPNAVVFRNIVDGGSEGYPEQTLAYEDLVKASKDYQLVGDAEAIEKFRRLASGSSAN